MPVLAPGIRGQTHLDDRITIVGTITTGGTAQLLLNQQPRRLSFEVCNNSVSDLVLGIGPAIITAAIASNQLSTLTITNAGLGYTIAPQVVILGGVIAGDLAQSPSHPAAAHCTISGGAISAITIDDPGAGYQVAPTVYLANSLPYLGGGALIPSLGANNVGIIIGAGFTYSTGGSMITTASAVAIIGATTGQAFTVSLGGLV